MSLGHARLSALTARRRVEDEGLRLRHAAVQVLPPLQPVCYGSSTRIQQQTDGGFHSHGGTPKMVGDFMENPMKVDDNWG